MKSVLRLIMITSVALVALGFATKIALAQDPVKVAPDIFKVLLENDQVRVLDIHLKPGQKQPMHSHPDRVAYSFNTGKVKVTSPDGKTTDREFMAGEVAWRSAETHSVENVGTTERHALNIELKEQAKGAGKPSAVVPADMDPVKVAPNNYKEVFKNDRVRVCEVHAKPGDKVGMHSHPDHLAYFVKGGKIKFSYPDGKTEVVEAKTSEAQWFPALTHAAENVGDSEFHVLVVEFR